MAACSTRVGSMLAWATMASMASEWVAKRKCFPSLRTHSRLLGRFHLALPSEFFLRSFLPDRPLHPPPPSSFLRHPKSRFFSNVSPRNEDPDFEFFLRKARQASPSNQEPNLDFKANVEESRIPYLPSLPSMSAVPKKVYYESYGCQMNVNDLEIVLSILRRADYTVHVDSPEEADLILVNTCAIRDNSESRVWQRLNYFKYIKNKRKGISLHKSKPSGVVELLPRIAVLGCMAERLKEKLIDSEKMVDVVCGPDAYRDLPRLLKQVDSGQVGVNTLLSLDETYADVVPVRISKSAISAFVSIMRGCDNMCSYCIVPFTRGRERSRSLMTILKEVQDLWDAGVREVTLLGQNVNSYRDMSSPTTSSAYDPSLPHLKPNLHSGSSSDQNVLNNTISKGFKTIYKPKEGGIRFTQLLDEVSMRFPGMRFRFTSPHPKDFPNDLLLLMKERKNICKSIHLPAQSGSTSVLERMRRGYTREAYVALAKRIRSFIPNVALSSDFITGFCGETEVDHTATLNLISEIGYDMAYMFAYSMRERTHAHRNFQDDVAKDVKQRRLQEMISVFYESTMHRYEDQVGRVHLVLVEGPNKRNPEAEILGKNDLGHRVVLPNSLVPHATGIELGSDLVERLILNLEEAKTRFGSLSGSETFVVEGLSERVNEPRRLDAGTFVTVLITSCTRASLRGLPIFITDLQSFGSVDHVFESFKF